jgi:putative NADH-flavin reductase
MLLIGTDQALLEAALERGIPVTVMARRKRAWPAGVRVVTGDVKFAASLAEALVGEEVVVSALRGGDVGALSLAALVEGMRAAGVRRLVAVTSELDDAVLASGLDAQIVSSGPAALDTLEA